MLLKSYVTLNLEIWTINFIYLSLLWTTNGQIAFPEEDLDYCNTPDGKTGICETIVRCDHLLNARNVKLLRQSMCGFEDDIPKVCCPSEDFSNVEKPITSRPTKRPVTDFAEPTTPLPLKQPNNPSNGRAISGYPDRLPQICGNRSGIIQNTRIVGGKPSKPGSWPWMAAIFIEESGTFSHLCGGALVSDQHIITASHCVVENGKILPANRFKVRLGEHNIAEKSKEDAEVDYRVRAITSHPDFEPSSYKNDIAILKLARNVRFSQRIWPICLPFDSQVLTSSANVGRSGLIAGWGRLSFNGRSSDVLREADLEIVSNEQCNKAFEKIVEITEQYLCAGSMDSKRDSCQGDSGGPLIQLDPDNQRYYLSGVVSFGRRCATPGYPGVYARVAYFLDWISSNL